jgi:hypothetical protein
MLVSNLMFDEILMYKKARKMQHSQTEKGVEQENENHMIILSVITLRLFWSSTLIYVPCFIYVL